MTPTADSAARHRRILVALLAVALAVRLAHWLAVRHAPFVADLVMDSKEYDRWAREIAAGDWVGSGAFFQAPLYPYILAVVYRFIGHSLDAVYLLQIGSSVGGCWALYRAARVMAGPRAGLASAALAALYGPFVFYDVQLLKESFAISVTCFLLWAIALARSGSLWRWGVAGALLGVLALMRENALVVVPFLLPLAWRREGGPRAFVGRVGGFAIGLALALAPVAVRNGYVGGDYLPTTFNPGVSFYIGNNPKADGTYRPLSPGKQVPALEREEPIRIAEQEAGRPLSPAEISSFWMRRSLAWAAEEPAAFARLQLRKIGMFWSWYEWPDAVDYYYVRSLSPVFRLPLVEFGTVCLLAVGGLWFVRREAGPLAPALLFGLGWTVSTVVFFLFSRYRLPVVPALLVLAGLCLERLGALWRAGSARWAVVAGIAAAFVLPAVVRFEPRMDLVHYNLGRLAEERGDAAGATAHYEATLADNPDDFLACLNLGTLAAQRGDWPTARRLFERAAEIEPASDDVQANLGGVLMASGDLEGAQTRLERALAINPSNRTALYNAALLFESRGARARAAELNTRLLRLDPGNAAALRMRDRVTEATGTPPR